VVGGWAPPEPYHWAVSMMTKTEAQVQLASIVTPINIKQASGWCFRHQLLVGSG
jgi:hypothetical protein